MRTAYRVEERDSETSSFTSRRTHTFSRGFGSEQSRRHCHLLGVRKSSKRGWSLTPKDLPSLSDPGLRRVMDRSNHGF